MSLGEYFIGNKDNRWLRNSLCKADVFNSIYNQHIDQKSARKFIRSIFPKLYLYAFLVSITITLLIIYHGTTYSVIFFIVSSGFLFSKIFLVRWINDVSDIKQKTSKQIKKFKILHSLSVLIFITQIVCMTIVYFKV